VIVISLFLCRLNKLNIFKNYYKKEEKSENNVILTI